MINEEGKSKKSLLVVCCVLIIVVCALLVCVKKCNLFSSNDNVISSGDAVDNNKIDNVEFQIDLIMDNKDVWMFTDEEVKYGQCGYAVTDLDHNGRLEIIASSLQGTGLYTYSKYYEVNDTFDGLNEIKRDVKEGDSEADIMDMYVRRYYDASNDLYYYIFEDVMRNGVWGHIATKINISLQNGELKETYLASAAYTANENEEGKYDVNYCDANGNSITENEYINIDKVMYKDFKYDLTSLNFIMLNDEIKEVTSKELMESYNGFGNVIDEEEKQ